MSLQIWLPLNKQGDFTNRGVGDLNITSNAAQYNNEGKIGGCVLCNSSQRLTFTCQDWFKFNPSTKFSVALWIKGCTNDGWLFSCNSWELQFRTYTIRFYPGPTGSYYPAYWDTTVDPNRWYHICGTWDGHKSCLYVDGELKCTTEIPETATFYDFYDHKNFYLTWSNTSYINDFRLYDHALSPKEVKEISQGLVLHYKLDDLSYTSTTNLLKDVDTPLLCYQATTAKYGFGELTDAYLEYGHFQGRDCYKIYNKGVIDPYCLYPYIKQLNSFGQKKFRTVSFWYYPTVGDKITFYSISGKVIFHATVNGTKLPVSTTPVECTVPVNTNQWNRIVVTGESTEDTTEGCGYFRIPSHPVSTTDYWLFADIQVEEKNYDTLYTETTRTESVIYDGSGYNIDGTIVGNLAIGEDSPRYDKCVINTENKELLYTPINFPESYGITFNFWTKVSDYGYQFSGMIATSSNSIPTDYATTALHQYDSNFSLTGTDGSQVLLSISREEIPINQWKMVTITHDGNLVKLYIDGEFIRSTTLASNLVGFNSLFLGWSKAGEADRYYKGGWSDFRIYSTALSAEDVKDLYETSTIIDNKGVLHTRELKESVENIFTLERLLETVNINNYKPNSSSLVDNPRWVERNGQKALPLAPGPFYFSSTEDPTGLMNFNHLKKYFKPGKQYKFDMWIDADNNYTSSNNYYGGCIVKYTDGTNQSLRFPGIYNQPKGFQHIVYYSDPTKTIYGFGILFFINVPTYYRSDSSITEVKDVDIQKSGIVEAPWLVDTNALLGTASQYDTNIYEEPDGSRWVRIFHHANPTTTNLFSSTDAFTGHVYKDTNRWFDVSVCNQLSSWELMVKQKINSSDTLQKYRWKQNVNPMIATEDDVAADKVIYDTSSGYTSCPYKGLYKLNSYTYLSQGAIWWGAIGSWSYFDSPYYGSGIPGWNNQVISETGYMDLYVRIDDTFKKETNIYDNKIECSSLIEI